MSMKFRLPRPAVTSRLKRAGPIAAVLMAALVLVPSASSGNYGDASGDAFGNAGDITSVTVAGDKGSGQVVFRITGTNLASSKTNNLYLDIDADANPLTGSQSDNGAEYEFAVDDDSYWFAHWDGSQWTRAANTTVRVTGDTSELMISVNRSELGNSQDFNFVVTSFDMTPIAGNVVIVTFGIDSAPDEGAYNYSFDYNGPQIDSVDVTTTPSAGPKAGKSFVIVPTALHLPPDGRATPAAIVPESYSCSAMLGTKKLAGRSTGGCTMTVPKKKARGKKLTVQLTVNYQGGAKVVPLRFKVK
jgi:hypothetical protein